MNGYSHSCIHMRHIFGYKSFGNLFVVVLLVVALLCASVSAMDHISFADKLDKIIKSPSRHGERVERPKSLKPRRIRRSLNESALPESDYEDDGCSEYEFYLYEELYEGPVCDIIDARNNPSTLRDLQNCTIVNGFVHLLFMHDISEADLLKYRFPKLRVITHYLLVYRMLNMRSLRHMFPNLAVIGGLELFKDYSVIIYENPHLTEIGLKSLQFINRGTVRIEKNSNLCYLDTVKWEQLGAYSKKQELSADYRVIKDNRPLDQCVDLCGNEGKCKGRDGIESCWGHNLCQKKKCPSECPHACINNRCECHEQCLAGCTKRNDPSACIACKDKYHNGTCMSECPEGTYVIHNWLCITKAECMRYDWMFHDGKCQDFCPSGYQIEHKDCMKQCVKCTFDCGIVCTGGIEVNDVNSLYNIKSCREIEGSLTISINGGSDVVKQLDDAFKDLELIGSLIVKRSFPLVSLSFLRNVRQITGSQMEQDIYSVYILDNQNLKELWDVKKSNLTILKGKAFFHFNPQLCKSEVNKVEELTKPVEDDKDINKLTNGDRAVCNMEKIKILKVEHYQKDWKLVMIWWENTYVKDQRTLIGYQVLYKKSYFKNATKYEGVDACGLNSWTIVDKAKSEEDYSKPKINISNPDSIILDPVKLGNTSKLLNDLEPFTQYAYYIKAYTTSTATRGAESEIHYFRTKPAEPTRPEHLKATSTSPTKLWVQWTPPAKPNGNITHYVVEWRRQKEENRSEFGTCLNGRYIGHHSVTPNDRAATPQVTKKPEEKPPEETSKKDDQCCSCNKVEDKLEEKEKDAEDSLEFENFLQDHLIFYPIMNKDLGSLDVNYDYNYDDMDSNMTGIDESPTLGRFRRDLRRYKRSMQLNGTTAAPIITTVNLSSFTTIPTTSAPPENSEYAWHRTVVNGTSVNLTGLHHFTGYDVMVYACNHDSDPRTITDLTFPIRESGTDYTPCGMGAIMPKRTLSSVEVDVIPARSLNVTTREVQGLKGLSKEITTVTWKMPVDPNAYIQFFQIEVNSTESKDVKTKEPLCANVNITTNGISMFNIEPSMLQFGPGTYTARVRPVSLAGAGNWTEPVEFTLHDLQNNNASMTVVIVLSVTTTIFLLALVMGVYLYKMRGKRPDPMIYADMNPEYSRCFYTPDEYEIDAEMVTLLEEIGHGNFGKVFVGWAESVIKDEDRTKVAVKKLHENANPARRMEFLKEASMMKAFNAHHVVRLLGVVSKVVDPMVIMEYMEGGDLKSFLRSRRPNSEDNTENLPIPTLAEKLQMAAEVADGMMYLTDNKFVHRDLAARNCLVHSSGTVKIGDFGLTRDIYETDYYRKESRGFLPIRWMAPESLKDGIFDTRSDVWSYGVVLWELATLAEQPYQGLPHDEVTRFVIDGGYMERPKDCPRRLYELMTTCWQYNPKMRPEFREVVQELYADVTEEFKQLCYYRKSLGNSQDYEDNDGHYPLNQDRTGHMFAHGDSFPSPGHQYLPNSNHIPLWAPMDTHSGFAAHQREMGGNFPPPVNENEEKRGLLQPYADQSPFGHESGSLPRSGDGKSPNTTSTTALSPSSNEDPVKTRGRSYSSESSYENGYEDIKPTRNSSLHAMDPNLGDSGTFVTAKDPLISYSHLNGGGHKKKYPPNNIEVGIESGVDVENWGNSSSNSISNPSTPTETEAMIQPPKAGPKESNRLINMIRTPGPTTSC